MFLLSASSEKTKTITTTLRLLFYVEILWSNQSLPRIEGFRTMCNWTVMFANIMKQVEMKEIWKKKLKIVVLNHLE